MIVSFIPALPDGSAAVSSGVERELQHAHEAAKEVFVIWQGAAESVGLRQTDGNEGFPYAGRGDGLSRTAISRPDEAGISGGSR